uniref:Uncharacterized protein n=1 Tax=viral metagenome TaxID=1070528 RepID=A0A6M3XW59_9ZZZZ
MGDKTFAEFKSELVLNLANREGIDAYTGGWINAAYLDLCTKTKFWSLQIPKKFLFYELQATVNANTIDGTAYIATPSDCVSIYAVWDSTSDVKLKRINLRQYINYVGREDVDSEDTPARYVRSGGNIYLHPTPDAVYAMRTYYRKRPAVLTGTDKTIIGAEWDEVILDLATIKGMMKLRMYDDYKIWKIEWIESVSAKMGMYDSERDDTRDILKPDIAYIGYGRNT